MITTIFIDIDNTLLDFGKCSESSIIKAFKDNNLVFTDNVINTFHKINNKLWSQIEDGSLTKEGLHQIRWKLIFEQLKIDFNGVEFENQFVSNLRESHETVEGAYEFLKYLSDKNYTLCAASNGPYEQQCHRLECADMIKYFKHIFVSENIGIAKPNVKFFEECNSRLGNIPKEEMLLIGDSLSADIVGGINYGIKTCWFNYANSDENSQADYQINKLIDIKEIL